MSLAEFVELLIGEVGFFDAEILAWESMMDFFDTVEDTERWDNQEIIVCIDQRLILLRERREQLMGLLTQISGLEEVAA